MSKRSFIHLVCCALLSALMAVMPVVAVFACSCVYGPEWRFLSNKGILPGNARGVLWEGDFNGKPDVLGDLPVRIYNGKGILLRATFEKVSSDLSDKLWLFRPADGFKPGKTYVFKFNDEYPNLLQELKITSVKGVVKSPEDPVPLVIGKPQKAKTGMPMASQCHLEMPSMQIPVEMIIPADLKPFKNQFFYQTFVDGEHWYPSLSLCWRNNPGESWNNKKGADLLFTGCFHGTFMHGLKPGKHRVELRASLPGTDFKLVSKSVEIEMRCPPRQ